MDQLTQTLGAAVADLQAFQAVAADYEDLPKRIANAKTELAAVERSLQKAKTDLRVANDALARMRAANVKKHRTEVEEKLQALRELEIAIGNANGELDQLAQATREAQSRHNGLLA